MELKLRTRLLEKMLFLSVHRPLCCWHRWQRRRGCLSRSWSRRRWPLRMRWNRIPFLAFSASVKVFKSVHEVSAHDCLIDGHWVRREEFGFFFFGVAFMANHNLLDLKIFVHWRTPFETKYTIIFANINLKFNAHNRIWIWKYFGSKDWCEYHG